jgi:uncharacterized protein YggU (UPF0235/DUF167 family)
MTALPYRLEAYGLLLFLRVTPKAGSDRIAGIETRDDGTAVLRVLVRAVPDRGKANAAATAVVAKALRVPKSRITLVGGDTTRLKTLRISGDPDKLAGAVTLLLTAQLLLAIHRGRALK